MASTIIRQTEQMEQVMTVSPDIKLAQIKDLLTTVGGISPAEEVEDAERRAMLTVWVQTAPSKQLKAVINFLNTTRFRSQLGRVGGLPPVRGAANGSGSDGRSDCYWERLSGLGGRNDDIIASELAEGQQIVEILPADVAFQTKHCQPWEKIG